MSFQLQVRATDAQGEPVGQSLVATVVKLVESGGRITERDLKRKPLLTNPKTGQGSITLKIDDSQGGRYILRVTGTDQFINPIVADRGLSISGKSDQTTLRLLAEKLRYKVGEEPTVDRHGRDRSSTALLTWEADRILTYKIATLEQGDNPIVWAIDGPQFPNFTLTATRCGGTPSIEQLSTSRWDAISGSRSRRQSRGSGRAN